jgi:hypothetical protein
MATGPTNARERGRVSIALIPRKYVSKETRTKLLAKKKSAAAVVPPLDPRARARLVIVAHRARVKPTTGKARRLQKSRAETPVLVREKWISLVVNTPIDLNHAV